MDKSVFSITITIIPIAHYLLTGTNLSAEQRTYNYCHCRPRSRLSWLKMLLAFLLPGGGCLGRPWTGDCWGCNQGVRGSAHVFSQPSRGLTIRTLCSNEACYLSWMQICSFQFVFSWVSKCVCERDSVWEWVSVCERESLCDNTTTLLLNTNP